VYALDTATGEPLWESIAGPLTFKLTTQVPEVCFRKGRQDWKAEDDKGGETVGTANGCPMIADGVVAVKCQDDWGQGSAVGLDLRTGRVLWTEREALASNATAMRWTYQADPNDPASRREYFICHSPGRPERMHEGKIAGGILRCIEPKTGKVMWILDHHGVPWNQLQSPSVHEDYLVCRGAAKDTEACDLIQCYRITPQGAKLLWKHDTGSARYTAPVIHRKRVFIAGAGIYDLETGRLLEKTGGTAIGGYAPVASDGYLIGSGNVAYKKLKPGAPVTKRTDITYASCDGGPAVADGLLYIRSSTRFHCLDLRKREQPAASAPATGNGPDSGLAGLAARHFTTRRKAIEGLKKNGAPAAELAKLILERTWLTRKAAAEILQAHGAKGASAAPQLAAALPELIALTTGKDYESKAYKPYPDHKNDRGRPYPEIRVPVIRWLAGECLKAMGPSVIKPLTAAAEEYSKASKVPSNWLPFSVLGHFGTKAAEALPLLERLSGSKPPFKDDDPHWRWVQLQRIRGESFEYVSVWGRRYGLVALDVPSDELVATLRGTRTDRWPVATRALCRRGREKEVLALNILCDTVEKRKKRFALEAIVVLGEHASWCNDAATRRRAIKTLCTVVAEHREDLVLPAVEALGCFGKHAVKAVSVLEGHMTANAKVEKAIDTALVAIRGKPRGSAIDEDDDLLPGLE